MKKWLFVAVVLLVTVAVTLSVFLTETDDTVGMTFARKDSNRVDKVFEQTPNTFEAWIKFPKDYDTTADGGVILGNFDETKIAPSINFEIVKGGQVRFHYVTENATDAQIFDKANVYNGKWNHVAVVNDKDANTLSCYINGKMVQSFPVSMPENICAKRWVIGGDYRTENKAFFAGEIRSVALYTDARTKTEIKADMKEVGTEDLLAAWDLSQGAKEGIISDLAGNGYDLHMSWYTDKPQLENYDYSFALVGDTQIVNFYNPDKLADIYDWIVENKEKKKIAYVMGLGDITDKSMPSEWQNAAQQIAKLDGVVDYSLVRGNHDVTYPFNDTFNKEPYISSFDGQYDYKLENTWRKFEVCGVKYLIFTLDVGPDDDVLAWAGEIIEDHPDYNVIITTHVYLGSAGTRLSEGSAAKYGGKNEPEVMWDKLFKKHENIVMVISGHVSSDYVVTTRETGEKGNQVIQMLVDPQGVDGELGPTGMITMLYFSENGSKVTLETYSTVNKAYFFPNNQYEFDMPVVE